MAKTKIFKYQISTQMQSIYMNKNATILSAQTQDNKTVFWATFSETEEMAYRTFHLFLTGEPIDNELLKKLKFIGTYQQNFGAFVSHLFEEIN